jgi:hypothetical protein
MGKYDPVKLEREKYGVLGIYINDLQELKNGNIPISFETHTEMLRETLPFFSDDKRVKYQMVLDAGISQVKFFRASQTVDALKEGESIRKKTIDDFLNQAD